MAPIHKWHLRVVREIVRVRDPWLLRYFTLTAIIGFSVGGLVFRRLSLSRRRFRVTAALTQGATLALFLD